MSSTGTCSFSYAHFRDIVTRARTHGFEFVQFGAKYPPERRVLLLRHDIDLDMTKAVAMARTEAELGIRSTYFLQISTPFYNLFDRPARAAAREIVALGHEVGLHFDTRAYPEWASDGWEPLIESEAQVLEECIGSVIRCVSFHRPTPDLLNLNLDGITSAYSPRYFSDLKYLSDSGMRWREGCACTHLCSSARYSFQILIHPIWWSDEPRGGVVESLLAFEIERCSWVRAQLEANISTYRPTRTR
jgi:hypothetical protein